jgi:hypothetical protein
MDVFERRTDIL